MTRREMLVLAALCASVVLGIGVPVQTAGKGGGCKDVPLRATLLNTVVDLATGSTVQSRIYGDGRGEYTNGVSGVSALVRLCAGTYDAVVNVSTAKRTFTLDFPAPISGSVMEEQPTWVPGTSVVSGWFNVRNILFSADQPFTTRLGTTFTRSGDRSTYRLGFMPFLVDATDLHTDPAEIPGENVPFDSSPVTVHPQPFNCGPTGTLAPPSWRVLGNNLSGQGLLQVGTLHRQGSNGTLVHGGQYTMPFEFRLEALQCFTWPV